MSTRPHCLTSRFTMLAHTKKIALSLAAITALFGVTRALAQTVSYDSGNTYDLGGATIFPLDTAIFNGGTVINGTIGATTFDARSGNVSATLAGSGSLIKTTNDTLTLSGYNTYVGGTTISAGTLVIGTGGVISDQIVNNANLVFARGGDFGFSGTISGTGNVGISGMIFRFTSAQTYTGQTSIYNSGYLVLPTVSNQVLAASSTIDIEEGSFLDLSNSSLTIAGLTGGGSVYSYSGSSGHLTVNVADGQQTFDGTLGSGSYTGFAFTKAGAGTLILTRGNTYTGGTAITGGTLQIASFSSLSSGDLSLDGGTLRWANGTASDYTNRNISIGVGGGTIDTNGHDVEFATAISSTGTLTKTGSGTLYFTAGSNYTNNTTITGGTLSMPNAIFDACAVTVSGAGSTLTGRGYLEIGHESNASLTLTDGGAVSTGSTLAVGLLGTSIASASVSGTDSRLTVGTTLYVGYLGQGTVTIGDGGTAAVGSQVYLGYENTGTGTLNLNSGGTLEVGGTDGIVRRSGTANLNLNGGTLKVTGSNFSTTVSATLANTSTIDTNGFNATLSGNLTGTGGLTKTGTGTLTLSAGNSFSGATTISAGTLALTNDRALTNSSGIDLGTAGVLDLTSLSSFGLGLAQTLSGSGTVQVGSGHFFGIDGTLAPGHSAGLIDVTGDLSLSSLSTSNFELGGLTRGTGYDALNVDGALTFGGTLNVTFINGFTPTAGNSFDLFNYATATGTFDTLNLATLSSGLAWDTSALYTTGTLSINATAVPEPATWAAIFGLAALGLAVWRKRRV